MNAEEFADWMTQKSPTRDDLLDQGEPETLVDEILAGYACQKRKEPIGDFEADPILDLMNRFETEDMVFGFLSFLDKPEVIHNEDESSFIVFAYFDADPFAINPVTNNIVWLDWAQPSFIMAIVAADSFRFLEMLTVYVGGDATNLEQWFNECLKAAGKNADPGFYYQFTGYMHD